MADICPTVTAEDLHTYRSQLERIEPFANRIHLDFMDGLFAPNKSIPLEQAWAPKGKQIDLHLMYLRPDLYIEQIKLLNPSLVIVHAEAQGSYEVFSIKLRTSGIKTGVSLLQETPVSIIKDYLDAIDHVLIFSGDLGHFGGHVDLGLLEKVKELKHLKPDIEIGWDGGVNDANVKQLADGGVDVLNVGGFIQKSEEPLERFNSLVTLVN